MICSDGPIGVAEKRKNVHFVANIESDVLVKIVVVAGAVADHELVSFKAVRTSLFNFKVLHTVEKRITNVVVRVAVLQIECAIVT